MIFVAVVYAAMLLVVFVIWFLDNIAWIISEISGLMSRFFGG
jgi:hypothetical protein